MLHKCANPACSNVFRRLSEGKLFQVQTEYANPVALATGRNGKAGRRVEHFWLCEACAAFLTLAFDKTQGVVTVPLPDGGGRKPLTPAHFDDEERRPSRALLLAD